MSDQKAPKLRLLQGNAGRREIRPEPVVPTAIPSMPAYLSKAARAEWRRTAPILHGAGLIGLPDRQAFARYCTLVARISEAEETINREGLQVTTPNGFKQQHPMISVVNSCSKQLNSLCDRFGMSPRARSQTHVELKAAMDVEWDSFMASRGD